MSKQKKPDLVRLVYPTKGGGERTILAARIVNVAQGVLHLTSGRAVTAAGDNGAINVHRDRNGEFHCERMRYRITEDVSTVRTVAALKRWLGDALKRIQV